MMHRLGVTARCPVCLAALPERLRTVKDRIVEAVTQRVRLVGKFNGGDAMRMKIWYVFVQIVWQLQE